MEINKKEFSLSNGKKIEIRTLDINDAKELIRHRLNVANSTEFMNRIPEEIDSSITDAIENINSYLRKEDSLFLGAFHEGKLVGTCAISPVTRFAKISHRGEFGMSVDKEYRNMGIGKLLCQALIKVAPYIGFEQIELTVVTTNSIARHLYSSLGFVKTGDIPHAYKLTDGTYLDQEMMILNIK